VRNVLVRKLEDTGDAALHAVARDPSFFGDPGRTNALSDGNHLPATILVKESQRLFVGDFAYTDRRVAFPTNLTAYRAFDQ
jgi:hypothetical protein